MIRDKFNATQSARFVTNSIPKRLKKSVKQANSVKHKETDTFGFQLFLHHPLGTVSLNHTVLLNAFLRLEWVGGGLVTNKVCDEEDVS